MIRLDGQTQHYCGLATGPEDGLPMPGCGMFWQSVRLIGMDEHGGERTTREN